ncbi:phytase [Novosphingobium sp.]|uniref:phytase n=1 Tax=Novosphingobium sp. TaxID=1874826 RepID=UPI0027359E71|nr:phytase [Novosphingobium sp.]MDP3907585.1 phytase [Novosphingobium sp.]
MRRSGSAAATFLAAAALASLASAGLAQTVSVTASAETTPVGTANDDAADDPAIWRNPAAPARSLIVGTDKKAGLYVYGLDGQTRHFEPAGRLNNVDLLDLGRRGVIVVASDRNDPASALLRLYRLNPRTGALAALGTVSGGAGEAYGVCLLRTAAGFDAFSVLKDGAVHQVRIDLSGKTPSGQIVRTLRLATQTEGCVADPRTRTLYVGEEDRGIWSFAARADAPVEGQLVAPVDGAHLVADVEGLALMPQGRKGGLLVASSQGDNAYALYRLPGMTPAGRFRIGAGALGSVEETDGIALAPGNFGRAFPQGLFVAQDGDNAPAAQNFKLVSWRAVKAAVEAGK